MIVQIDVTQEDIDKGRPRRADECPVARAIQRLLIDDVYAAVTGSGANIRTRALGEKVSELNWGYDNGTFQFVCDFAAHFEVAPFSFECFIPEEYLKCKSQ